MDFMSSDPADYDTAGRAPAMREAPAYTPQNYQQQTYQPVYQPSYQNYNTVNPMAVSSYGQNFQPYFSQGIGGFDYGRMFGNMPSYQSMYQMPYAMGNYGGGIADLYSKPQYFSNYGISGLYR